MSQPKSCTKPQLGRMYLSPLQRRCFRQPRQAHQRAEHRDTVTMIYADAPRDGMGAADGFALAAANWHLLKAVD